MFSVSHIKYKLIQGNIEDCQDWLNNLKDEFNINILSMCPANHSLVTILFTIEKSELLPNCIQPAGPISGFEYKKNIK